ncbi:Glutamate decarboxylase 2 [Dispira parvispora]|uniref:Glutamate decarboxylase 2 n=1 Tax=Dispira parvispora TaxID=1520584 RepID=A0A9W8AP01_9FUNG|nr:Glutamate decarboxylase 2 [Dispira parvispora]
MKELAVEYVKDCQAPNQLVVEKRDPQELAKLLDLTLPTKGVGAQVWNPRFMDKLYAATNPVGVLSELFLGLVNANNHVYHVSPVFTLMEVTTARKLGIMFGYPSDTCGGITNPGGSMSNMVAVVTARNHLFPELKAKGLSGGPRLSMFVSQQSHYSFLKAAFTAGIGTDHVISVPCNALGQMEPQALEDNILASRNRGEVPFFVAATAGTTVMGAFDPMEAIADIAARFNLWFHVDGSWGGSIIFSKSYGHLMRGAGKSDSLTVNPHKLLGVPLQCSYLLIRDKSILNQSNTTCAQYLFHGDEWDLGNGSLGCGRRPDAVKLFLAWKYFGTEGFDQRLTTAFKNAQYLANLVKFRSPRFRLVADPASFNVCFWYIPTTLAHLETQDPQGFTNRLGEVTRTLHGALLATNTFMLDYSPVDIGDTTLPDFFRAICNSPSLGKRDLDFLVNELERLGKELYP